MLPLLRISVHSAAGRILTAANLRGMNVGGGSKKKSQRNKKDSQLVVGINKQERDAFIAICDEMDTSASREVRRFIREFLKQHPPDSD